METLLVIIALVLTLVGLIGCILPGLPGPTLNYLAVIFMQFAWNPFSTGFLIAWALVVIAVSVLDYFLPLWVARKSGATRQGIIGSYVGLVLGLVFPPIGLMVGLILGAIAGDMIAGRPLHQALRSGLANAFGTLLSTGFKLIVSGVLAYYVIGEMISRWW